MSNYYPRRPKVTWRTTRQRINEDMAAYSDWPRAFGIYPFHRPWLWQFLYLFFTTHMFKATFLHRLQAYLWDRGLRTPSNMVSGINHTLFGVTIGPEVRSYGALYFAHGHVVMDGYITLNGKVEINPFVTIGLTNSSSRLFDLSGPVFGDDVNIGTGAKVLGPVTIGNSVKIGANAVVLDDIPDGHSAVGMPARSFVSKPNPGWAQQQELANALREQQENSG